MRKVLASFALALGWVLAPGCSLDNREGPDVTCAMLECGRINACKDGIIAGCPDGKTVQWTVCPSESKELCEEDWQTKDAYRCDEFAIDCEGCNPALAGCGAGG